MSREYTLYCLSHDPAIEASSDLSMEAALEQAVKGIPDHPRCDLVVACYSGGLIEVGCPAMAVEPRIKAHSGWHRDPIWADAGWLRLAVEAWLHLGVIGGSPLGEALRKAPFCWPQPRLMRLRNLLGAGER